MQTQSKLGFISVNDFIRIPHRPVRQSEHRKRKRVQMHQHEDSTFLIITFVNR